MSLGTDPLAFYGRNVIQDYHTRLRASLSLEACQPHFCVSDGHLRLLPETKVGILGAGIAGLYAALILDSLGIEYEILEASDRTGGRILTHKFPGGGKYDYYDAGAMRFPFPKKDSQGRRKDGIMKRLALLTEYGPLNEGRDRLRDSLVPYYYHARDGSKPGSYYYNGVREPVSDATRKASCIQGTVMDADYTRASADAIMDDIIRPFTRMLVQDIETGKRKGWEVLMANDSYTLQSYMATKYLPSADLELPPQHLPNNVINWCKLRADLDYDVSFVETVFSFLSFAEIGDTNYGDVEWKSFEGGTQTLTNKIEEYLKAKGCFIQFNKRVTAISQGRMTAEIPNGSPNCKPAKAEVPPDDWVDLAADEDEVMDECTGPGERTTIPSVAVTVNGNETYNYSHVISTLPLPVLRTADLSGAGLNVMQKNALRTLHCRQSTKIAILFKSNWWTTKLGIVGGQTFTDLPICTIVYPSYGVDSRAPSKVLIASYSWTSDAGRLGLLATTHREALLDLVLRNLTEAHSGLHPDVTFDYLRDQFVDMHVKAWDRDDRAMGAFADFGPGDFQDLYTSLTYPAANKRLHFAGEALSTRHGWIVGALDSSWRAVFEYLKVTGQDEKMKTFKALWGESCEWTNNSPLAGTAEGNCGSDLLDEHIGLVDRAVRDGSILHCHC